MLAKIFLVFIIACQLSAVSCQLSAQERELEVNLKLDSATIPLPKIFSPTIDLSGRGFHRQASWPQNLAAIEAIKRWHDEIGLNSFYRLQYNLWEISEFSKDKDLQNKTLENYENTIKMINNAGGVVVLNLFGTPAGLGKVLDKKSPPLNLKKFKKHVKNHIKRLSCEKKYNIWYEVWTAPDLEEFFLGRKQQYLQMYRIIAEAAQELSREYKVPIPVGGPGTSWWFQNTDANSVVTPEGSLVYELIKFCRRYRLPLDFISWHAYSTDPKTEKEITVYKKPPAALIRDWLTYFDFDKNTPLIVSEWNYDNESNVLSARQERSYVAASFIPARIKNMYEAGIDYHFFYCLEDFQNNKENVIRNVGIFGFTPDVTGYKGSPKAIYAAFRMLSILGKNLLLPAVKLNDEFVGLIPTITKGDKIAIIIYNYIDPEITRSYLTRQIATLNKAERRALLNIVNSDKLIKIMNQELDLLQLKESAGVKAILKKAQELNLKAIKYKDSNRSIQIRLTGLGGEYLYKRYSVDASSVSSEFSPKEEKEISFLNNSYQEALILKPYSLNMLILTEKPSGNGVITDTAASETEKIATEPKESSVEPRESLPKPREIPRILH
ncbi:MAG: hypothetical protein DRP74_04715 [Candidatus Omnitrophota bacterium]|nr:MAG: hypothetical protein DRP74_04715 [Candidatus Omnitrophota bacterium]